MNTLGTLRFFVWALAILAMGSSPLQADPPDAEESETAELVPNFKIVPGEGVGEVKFGMSMEAPEVKKLQRWVRHKRTGMHVVFAYGDKDRGVTAFRIGNFLTEQIIPPGVRELKTDKGIGLGASKDDVKRAYGMPERKERLSRRAFPEAEDSIFDSWKFPKIGLSFAFHNNRLVQIYLERPDEARPANKMLR